MESNWAGGVRARHWRTGARRGSVSQHGRLVAPRANRALRSTVRAASYKAKRANKGSLCFRAPGARDVRDGLSAELLQNSLAQPIHAAAAAAAAGKSAEARDWALGQDEDPGRSRRSRAGAPAGSHLSVWGTRSCGLCAAEVRCRDQAREGGWVEGARG